MIGVSWMSSFATATSVHQLKNSSNNENTVKSTASWLSVWKKWCLEKGIAKEIKITSRPAYPFLRAILRRNWKQTWLNLANDDFISSKVIRTQTEQFLELFSRTLNFFAPQRCKNIIIYYCFDRTRLFWPNAQIWINYFCTCCERFASA